MASILGAALQSTAGLSLYRDALDPVGLDLGDEFKWPQRVPAPVASPLMADVPGADTTNWISGPRPTVTAWRGSGLDAYYFDEQRGVWLHCITGEIWNAD
jgi:hypothetical protein